MTTIKKHAVLFAALFTWHVATIAQQVSDCEATWIKIGEVQKAMFEAGRFSVTATFQTTIDDVPGDELTVQVWKNDDKYVVDQPYMKVWADERYHAILMKEAKTLLLRSNLDQDEGTKALHAMSPQHMLDSARLFINAMACHCEKTTCAITVRYKTDHRLNTSKIAQLTMVYDKKTYTVREFSMLSYASGKKISHRVAISGYTTAPGQFDLDGNVLDRIASNGKLKKEFESYAFRDLRSE